MNKGMMSRIIESLMTRLVKRPVAVGFAHLGKERKYTLAIQKSLFEFDKEGGPAGTMYITFNSAYLNNTGEILQSLNRILDKYEE